MSRFKTILAAVVSMIALASCEQEIADFTNRLDDLESRVSRLEQLCDEMNSNISSLQTIVTAMQTGDYITSVTPLTADGKTIGYTITFAKGDPITIYHGQDGANGKDGKDGADGHTPVIGVKQDTDGIWYWTIDEDWLLNADGQKVKAVGTDGKDGNDGKDGIDGQDGADGKDGVTPLLKIEDGYWYVSTDNGQTWTKLDKATGENGKDGKDGKDGDSMFQSVTVTETDVTFVTADGQKFVIKRASALSIEFDSADLVVMGTNSTRDIHYTITSGIDDITIEALSSADIKVKVVKTDAKIGVLNIKTGAAIDEYSKVVVLVSNGIQAIMRTLNFEAEAIEVEENTTKEVSDEGGEVTLEFFSNVPCYALIPVEAQNWISVAPDTKAMEKQTIDLIVQPNTEAARSATVTVHSEDGKLELSYIIEQEKKQPIKALLPNPILPEGVDKTTITEIYFIVNSEQKTELTIGDDQDGYVPIFFEQKGTIVNYYTSGDVYDLVNAHELFAGMISLHSIDLSNVVTDNCYGMFAMFRDCESLRTIVFGSFNTEKVGNMQDMFRNCRSLTELDLSSFDTRQVISLGCMFLGCASLESVNISSFDTHNIQDFGHMFAGCKNLRTLDLSNFNTEKLRAMPCMFEGCKRLQSLNLSNFSSQSMGVEPSGADGLFDSCYDLVKLDLGDFDLSSCDTYGAMVYFAKFSKNCAIRCNAATRTKLSDYDSRLGASLQYITWVLPEEEIPELNPVVDPNLYSSTDYSKDKTVRILHQATKGNGVDIVLLGDAYSDRMIEDGTYDADMELTMNAIFKDEPYASFKDYFNVYTVYAVSENEIPFDTRTVFDASLAEDWGSFQQDQVEVYKYASIAFPDKDLADVAMILIINQGERYSWTDGVAGYEYSGDDANRAKSIGMIGRRDRSQSETFSDIVSHEFGHVFAKLGDEYIRYDYQIPDWEKEYSVKQYNQAGWWSNVDFTSDPLTVRWNRLLEDERYSGTIGIYEGGFTYASGVWRPSSESIMSTNQGMFNAPSREAIYKRIHKLALGEGWQYDYETFVQQDLKNIPAEQQALASPSFALKKSQANREHLFKMEESIAPDGRKMVTVIMD